MTLDRRHFLASAAALALPSFARGDDPPKGLVVGQIEGAEAGNAMLAAGGNAVDAVVTAALAAGVAALQSTGIAGYGGHLVVGKPDGTVSAIDFNGTAPAAAKHDMFPVDEKGVVKDRINAHGWLASGVPGVLAGLQLALDKFGTRKFPEVVKPAVKLARDGFVLRPQIANVIKTAAGRLAKDPGSAKLYLPGGQPPAAGSTFRNPDLAAMLEMLAANGRVDAFYTGDIAEKIAAAFKANGGILTAADLAAFKAEEVKPLALEWRGFTMHTPLPTAGGLTVLQALATLKALAWETMDPKDPATTQARVEALRVAWFDRLESLGDMKYSPRPVEVEYRQLVEPAYATVTADMVRAAIKAGKPIRATTDGRPSGGTIHLNAVDAAGTCVALTFTHGEAFGASVTVEGLGLTLGHGVSRFDPRPGRANSIAPGKRPLHNMCPTVVTKGGKPLIALGATGGRRIPNTLFDVLSYRVGESRPLADAVKAPRLHTEGDLNLTLEASWPAAVPEYFKKIGYAVKPGGGASLSAIERDPSGQLQTAAR
jgi:gamma-glutamyltranspeptidase/glutathione hydrolase